MSRKPNQKKGGLSLAQLEATTGKSRPTIQKYLAEGMPRDSVAAAKDWMATKRRPVKVEDTGQLVVGGVGAIADLEARVARARRLAESSQARAQADLDAGDGDAAKKSGDLASSAQKTLLLMERELQQRRIESRELVPMEVAMETTGKILSEVLAALKDGEVSLVEEANPDNPGRAQKAFRKWRDAALRRVSEIQTQNK